MIRTDNDSQKQSFAAQRFMRSLLLFVSAIAVASGCTSSDDANGDGTKRKSRRVEIGQEIPSYTAAALTGDANSLSSLRGNVVLLNVWATWCVPCREELPDLQELYLRFGSSGLTVVGVSIDNGNNTTEIVEFAAEHGVTFPIWHDPADRISGIFLANGVPATYLVGKDGTLRRRWMGPITRNDPVLNDELNKALSEQ